MFGDSTQKFLGASQPNQAPISKTTISRTAQEMKVCERKMEVGTVAPAISFQPAFTKMHYRAHLYCMCI